MATLLSRHIFEDIKKPEKSTEMYLMFLAKKNLIQHSTCDTITHNNDGDWHICCSVLHKFLSALVCFCVYSIVCVNMHGCKAAMETV